MDPLTALGLASNIVQLVDFGIQAAAKGRQIYKDGATVEHQDYMTTAQELSKLNQSLQSSIQGTAQTTLTHDEELRLLALKCHDQAGELQSELLKLSMTEKGRIRSVLSKTIKSSIRSGKINGIRNKLLGFQKILDSRILVRLHDQAKQVAFDQEERYEKLDGDLQYFITQLANGFQRSENVVQREAIVTRAHISAEHDGTRIHDTSEHNQTRDQIIGRMQSLHIKDATVERRDAFIRSFIFPEIHFRQEQIADAHRNTFEWIFDESGQKLRPWSNFVDWLKCSDSLYWINGKPGSGKSTLMNFICSDPRTKEHLSKAQTTAKSEHLVVTFFFWNAGNPMQKSARGLLQSLLYQLLTQEQDLYDNLIKTDPALQNRHPHLVWSPKILKNLLAAAIGALSRPLCVFLDGLDEFDEDEHELLEIVKVLRSQAGVKICISSRPSQSYEESFRGCAGLKLQDLTRESIKIYLQDTLFDFMKDRKFPSAESGQSSELIDLILDKAEGVFLWVEIAAKQIIKGLTERDTREILLKRVDSLPSKIEGIYQRMWDRYQGDLKIYADTARFYFRLILVKETSLLHFTIAINPDLQQKYLRDDVSIDEAEIIDRCEDTKIYVTTRCAGLLEISKHGDSIHGYWEPFSASRFHHNNTFVKLGLKLRLQFIHRTARDFVSNCLSTDSASERVSLNSEVSDAIVKSRCAMWRRDAVAKLSFLATQEFDYIRETTQITGPIRDDIWITLEGVFTYVMKSSTDKDIRRIFENPEVAVDFLGSAAEYGHSEVVSKRLSNTANSDSDYLNYILYCAVNSSRLDPGTLRLICQVVNAGASTKTAPEWLSGKYRPESPIVPWHVFLTRLWRSPSSVLQSPEMQRAVSTFLESGIDLDQIVPLTLFLGSVETHHNASSTRTYGTDRLILRANAASILRRMFGDEDWFASLEATFGLENQVDLFEAVLVYDSRGVWYRVSCFKDSALLAEIAEKILIAENQQQQYFTKSSFLTDFDDGDIKIRRNHRELAELLRETAEVLSRSAAVGRETSLQEIEIPGWTAQTTRVMLADFEYISDKSNVEHYRIPKRLLEGLGADSDLIDYAPESWSDRRDKSWSDGWDESSESEEDEDEDDTDEYCDHSFSRCRRPPLHFSGLCAS